MTISLQETTSAELFYFEPPTDGSRPYQNITNLSDTNCGRKAKSDVPIENLRGKENSVTLDTAGFQYYRHPANHTSFSNDDEIEREYYPESIDLLKELTGASRVVLFDHTVRRRRPDEVVGGPQKRQPAAQVHIDQTAAAAVARVHRHLPPADVPSLLSRRFQIINLWRPISHAADDWPLALCDYRSVDQKKDLVPVTLVYPDREGETYGVKENAGHRWKYLRGMQPDELVLIKCYDSVDNEGIAVFTPHTAFQDPLTPKDAPWRESIELRALVFYD